MRRRGWAGSIGVAYLAFLTWLLVLAEPVVLRRLSVRVTTVLDDTLSAATPGRVSTMLLVILFVPVGFLLMSVSDKLVATVLAGTWIAVMAEFGQVVLTDRAVHVVDVVASVAGVYVGVGLHRLAQASSER